MSTNYTENYNLCQWEASDKVLRVDFNEDNAKLDAALTAQKAAIDAAQTSADTAFRPEFPPVVVGSYHGNNETSRDITLGFRPRAVLLLPSSMQPYSFDSSYQSYQGGVTLSGGTASRYCPFAITEDGFRLTHQNSGSLRQEGNRSGVTYFYFAIR